MKFNVTYSKNFRHLQEVEEVTIPFEHGDIEILTLLKEIPQEQKVNLRMFSFSLCGLAENADILEAAAQVHSNLAVRLTISQFGPLLNQIKDDIKKYLIDKNIAFYLEIFVSSWDGLVALIELGVSEVFISNQLAFDLERVSLYCRDKNIKVRVIPNIAQAEGMASVQRDTFKSFFIRPEDLDYYENLIDTLEICALNTARESVVYDVYKNREWLGDLKDLIEGLDVSVYSKNIPPMFGEKRVFCQKRCYQSRCNLCDNILTLAEELKSNKIEIIREEEIAKDEHKINEVLVSLKQRAGIPVSDSGTE